MLPGAERVEHHALRVDVGLPPRCGQHLGVARDHRGEVDDGDVAVAGDEVEHLVDDAGVRQVAAQDLEPGVVGKLLWQVVVWQWDPVEERQLLNRHRGTRQPAPALAGAEETTRRLHAEEAVPARDDQMDHWIRRGVERVDGERVSTADTISPPLSRYRQQAPLKGHLGDAEHRR
jgi:hypothetical protein